MVVSFAFLASLGLSSCGLLEALEACLRLLMLLEASWESHERAGRLWGGLLEWSWGPVGGFLWLVGWLLRLLEGRKSNSYASSNLFAHPPNQQKYKTGDSYVSSNLSSFNL